MGALRRFSQLDRGQRTLALRALAWIPLARCALRLLPFGRVRGLFGWLARGHLLTGCSAEEIRWAVLGASWRLPGTRCLPRALVMQTLLRRAGIPAELRIGVARAPGEEFAAHAWVECSGQPFLEHEPVTTYTPLSPLPG